MVRPLQELDQFLNLIEALSGRGLQVPRLDFEGLSGWLLGRQAEAQKMIDHLLERTSRTPLFFLEQFGHIVVQGQSGSHILMLCY